MEDEAIKNGFANLQDGSKYEALYESALCRERADWIVGINATRLFSILYGQTLNVGRVMTPTLALVVERDAAIKGFKPKTFYTLSLICEGITLVSNRFDSTDEVRKLAEICHAEGTVKIQNVEKKDKKEKAPALFDLTNLQREANRKLGYTAQQTLDYTQSLYEKKLVTYPRTDSRYLTEDMEETLPGLLSKIQKVFNMNSTEKQNLHAVINGKKVTDHHAIIPTASIDKAELTELPMGEQEILKLIVMRLLESVSSSFLYSETVVEGISGGQVFRAKGKQIIDKGWKQIEPAGKDEKAADECFDLKLEMGDEIKIQSLDYKEGQTTPPKSFTEDTLLSAMEKAGAEDIPEEAERKGLGTPATRAGIIEKLVRVGFIERKGSQKTKYLIPTHKGEALITVVPEEIQSASMTAEWEQKLLDIERGAYSEKQFMEEIFTFINKLVETYEVIPDADVLMHPVYETIGKCPNCGNDVVEKNKGFFCSNKDCKFALWKENHFFDSFNKKMTKSIAEQLLKTGRVNLKNCKSRRTGKSFDCAVVLSVNENGQAKFALEFNQKKKK